MEALVQEVIQGRKQELESKIVEKRNKQTTDYLVKQEFSLERMEAITKRFAERTWIPEYKGKKTKNPQRKLNLILSDLHYGADLDPRLVPFPYFAKEESRRTAAICAKVADYKREYRHDTELEIHLIGDIIQGKLHDVQNAANLTEQFDRACHSLIYGIEFLAGEFQKVTIRTSVGNHGRDVMRHPLRAMQDKFDSNEFRIYRALKYRFEKVPNIVMETPMRSYYLYNQFGMWGMMTHGDTTLNPGFPGTTINIKQLKAKINEFKQSNSENSDNSKVCLFGLGHVHTAMDIAISGGERTTVITNGCLIPTDEYAQSISIYDTPCSQQLWETTPEYMFGDHRRLDIGKAEDEDASLNKIIPIWKDLES